MGTAAPLTVDVQHHTCPHCLLDRFDRPSITLEAHLRSQDIASDQPHIIRVGNKLKKAEPVCADFLRLISCRASKLKIISTVEDWLLGLARICHKYLSAPASANKDRLTF